MQIEQLKTKIKNANLLSLKERELLGDALEKAFQYKDSTPNDFALRVYDAFTYEMRTFLKIPPQFFDAEDWFSTTACEIFFEILELKE